MEEPPSDYPGRSGDIHLLKTRRQIHGSSQTFLETLTHHSHTLKAKANQRFHFTLNQYERNRERRQYGVGVLHYTSA